MNFAFDGLRGFEDGCDPESASGRCGDADSGAAVDQSGVPGLAGIDDVNPRCTSNERINCCPGGDYWTGPGSDESEARQANCNWVHNMLGVGDACRCGGSCRGSCGPCQCGCSWCKARQGVCVGGKPPTHTCPGLRGLGACVPREGGGPAVEGPTDAYLRCAGCWWVRTQLGVSAQQTRPPISPQPGQQQRNAPLIPSHGATPMDGIMIHGRPAVIDGQIRPRQTTLGPRGLQAPPRQQQQGLGAGAASAVAPSTVGLVAALGGVVGSLVGAGIATEMGQGYGEATARRAAIGGLVGMMVGSFAGAALVAPSVQAQGA